MSVNKIMNDEDLMLIARKAASPYVGVISEEDINSCILEAAWSLDKDYKKNLKTKRETYFYNGVKIHIKCFLRKYIAKNQINTYPNNLKSKYNGIERVDMLDEISKCQDPEMLYDRFYKSLTLKEIGKKYGLTTQGSQIRINKNLKIIKSRLQS